MYAHASACAHICLNLRACAHALTSTGARAHRHARAHARTGTHVYAHTGTRVYAADIACTHTYMRARACADARTDASMHEHTRASAHSLVQTHTRMYARTYTYARTVSALCCAVMALAFSWRHFRSTASSARSSAHRLLTCWTIVTRLPHSRSTSTVHISTRLGSTLVHSACSAVGADGAVLSWRPRSPTASSFGCMATWPVAHDACSHLWIASRELSDLAHHMVQLPLGRARQPTRARACTRACACARTHA